MFCIIFSVDSISVGVSKSFPSAGRASSGTCWSGTSYGEGICPGRCSTFFFSLVITKCFQVSKRRVLIPIDCLQPCSLQVRKDEQRKHTLVLRAVKEQRAKDAQAQTEAAQEALISAAEQLNKKFDGVSMRLPESAEDLPCAQFRKETLQCYQKAGAENPADCIPQVEAFTACARNVSKLNS